MTLAGYYAILDVNGPRWGEPAHLMMARERAERLLAAGPCMLQLRAKGATPAQLAALARAVLPAARAAGVPFCVNDRLDVALAVGADAVHLGQEDLPLADARNVARGRLLVGVSTHSVVQARAAVAQGADYIGFGPVFPTASKVNPDPVVGLAQLGQVAATTTTVPVVAIGGITLARVAEVAASGAAAAALIAAVEAAADPVAAGRSVNAAFGRR